MITLYDFGRVNRKVIGETRDLRVEWTLEETGLPYQLNSLDHTAGELKTDAFGRISPFHLLPVIDDEGTIVFESGAILLYLAEKAGKLIPPDLRGRIHVTEWCFAALNTVERPVSEIALIDLMDTGDKQRRAAMLEELDRYCSGLERRLAPDQPWIASDEFSVADILLGCVLRGVRKTSVIDGYPRLKAYYGRVFDRPAWHRALTGYAKRLDVAVADIA